jgi:hypothetical protein
MEVKMNMDTTVKTMRDYRIECANLAAYTPAGYKRLQAVVPGLSSYEEFVRKYERMVRGLEGQGMKTAAMVMDVPTVNHMIMWCKRHGHNVAEQKSRAMYGTILATNGGKLFDIEQSVRLAH